MYNTFETVDQLKCPSVLIDKCNDRKYVFLNRLHNANKSFFSVQKLSSKFLTSKFKLTAYTTITHMLVQLAQRHACTLIQTQHFDPSLLINQRIHIGMAVSALLW